MAQQLPKELEELGAKSVELPKELQDLGAKPVEVSSEEARPQMNFAVVNKQEVPIESLWDKANKPLVNLRSGNIKTATDVYAQEHPILGGIGNTAADTISSLSSPLSVGLGLLSGGSAVAEKFGLGRLAETLAMPTKAAQAGMVGHGLYNAYEQPNMSGKLAGGLEAGLGALGLRGGMRAEVPSEMQSQIELPQIKQAELPLTPATENVSQSSIQPVSNINISSSDAAISKLQDILDNSDVRPAINDWKQKLAASRADKFNKLTNLTSAGEDLYHDKLKVMSGSLDQPVFEPPRTKLEQSDINSLHQTIEQTGLSTPEKFRANIALNKVIDGQIPQDNEVDLLSRVFGPEMAQALAKRRTMFQRSMGVLSSISDASKTLVTAGHFSAPFRQAIGLITHKSWWGAWDDQFKAFISQDLADKSQAMIRADPNYQRAIDSGLAFTNLSERPGMREDAIRSHLVEKIPIVGPFALRGNRGYNAFINTSRMGAFSNLLDDASEAASLIKDSNERMLADPKTNLSLAKDIANYVNAASGRGSLGSLEKYSRELNMVLFSPRMQASRIQLVQMVMSPSTPYLVRKEAMKSLAAIMGVGVTVMALGKMAGGEVSSDSTNADFGKVKIGDTRIDPWTGYQQDVVLFSRLAQSVATSSVAGKPKQFGVGYNAPTTFSTIMNFGANRATPPLKVAYDWATNHQIRRGQWSFEPGREAASMITPILVKTVYDLYQDDPTLIPYIAPLNAVGIGVDTYGKR